MEESVGVVNGSGVDERRHRFREGTDCCYYNFS
ncbi:hypothetical protein A2U01_0038984, partial [Trifolium medium]|nr:hypothetical protein [Trifolium medium]MCI17833.1 hypothetical protein [Trifolium medium]